VCTYFYCQEDQFGEDLLEGYNDFLRLTKHCEGKISRYRWGQLAICMASQKKKFDGSYFPCYYRNIFKRIEECGIPVRFVMGELKVLASYLASDPELTKKPLTTKLQNEMGEDISYSADYLYVELGSFIRTFLLDLYYKLDMMVSVVFHSNYQLVKCDKCGNLMDDLLYTVLDCWHIFCNDCLDLKDEKIYVSPPHDGIG